MIQDKLQIFLITYNRHRKLKATLDSLLSSPVRDFDIIVLDNASTDGSSEMLAEYAREHKNITHVRHNVNIGGNANICRAFEMAASCGREYAWILCDDDNYDWSNWSAVESAIEQKPDLICVSDYIYPDATAKADKAYQIFQMTFVPATIFKTSLITNGVMMNMYDAIYTMFQQTCLTAHVINNNGTVVVLDKPVVFNGLHFDKEIDKEDVSYIRGTNDKSTILNRRKETIWVLGFCNIISLLKDEELKKSCMEISIPYKDISESWNSFYYFMYIKYFNFKSFNYFYEVFASLPKRRKIQMLLKAPLYVFKCIIKWTFSIDHEHIIILGFKIKKHHINPS